MKRVYFDNNATAPMYRGVFRAMKPYLTKYYGNPSSLHNEGRQARNAIEKAREDMAALLGCDPSSIIFTSGASEGNAWLREAFVCRVHETSHSSMLVGEASSKSNIKCWSVPYCDSETGTPHEIPKDIDYLVHVDITQAIGKTKFDITEFDFATASAHKFGGPKGVGFMYVSPRCLPFFKSFINGHQESGLRGGTENVAGIVGMARALEISMAHLDRTQKHIKKLKQKLVHDVRHLGLRVHEAGATVNITFKNLEANSAVSIFNIDGVAISAGSACNSGAVEPSKTLLYNGYSEYEALRTVRISFGPQNTMREVRYFIKKLKYIVDYYDNI